VVVTLVDGAQFEELSARVRLLGSRGSKSWHGNQTDFGKVHLIRAGVPIILLVLNDFAEWKFFLQLSGWRAKLQASSSSF